MTKHLVQEFSICTLGLGDSSSCWYYMDCAKHQGGGGGGRQSKIKYTVCIVWGAVCNITNSVDRIQFCWTEYNSAGQNCILSTELYSVQQNCILSNRIQFCPTEYNYVVVTSADYRWRYFLDIDWLEAIRCGVNIRNL